MASERVAPAATPTLSWPVRGSACEPPSLRGSRAVHTANAEGLIGWQGKRKLAFMPAAYLLRRRLQAGDQMVKFLALNGHMVADFSGRSVAVTLFQGRKDCFMLGHGLLQSSAQS